MIVYCMSRVHLETHKKVAHNLWYSNWHNARITYLASLPKSFRIGEYLQCTCDDFFSQWDDWNAVYEYNSRGKIPYVPIIQAPYFQWIGKRRDYTSKLQSTYPKYLNLQTFEFIYVG